MHRLGFIVMIVSLGGCGERQPDEVTTPVDATPETIEIDTAIDTGPETAPLFGRCTRDAECEGDNAACITTFPGGLCTHRCEGTGDCFVAGRTGKCVANVCLPGCAPGLDCSPFSGGCLQRVASIPVVVSGYCAPACSPTGEVKCIAGTVCDEYTNRCVIEKGTMGRPNGAACRDEEECLGGDCLREIDGYTGGYCRSLGVLPEPSAFGAGKPLPQSTCPPGSVVTPMHGAGIRTGSFTWCWQSCSRSTDCRTGYACRPVDGSSTGYCGPLDCRYDFGCPSDHKCAADGCSK
jgi:hypothetical protein